jgi:hypothetical protein
MSVGLDVGSSQIRSLRRRGDQLIGRSSRALFAVLPDAPEYRALLEAGQIPFAVCDGALALVGDNATAYSSLFHVRPQSLLPQGHLPANDPVARQCSAAVVDALLGEPDQPGEFCCVSLPGGEVSRSLATSNELEFFSRLIRLRGFTPQVLSAGMAAVLAHLVHNSFTGIGLSFGAATSELVLAHRGIEQAVCSSPHGGDWMDELIAEHCSYLICDTNGATYLDVEHAAVERHGFAGSLAAPHDEPSEFMTAIHRDLAYALIRSAAVELAQEPRTLDVPQPLPVIVVGGVARIRGFRELLHQTFEAAEFPLAIRDIQLVTENRFAVARGCLINAQLEAEVRASGNRAA